MAGGLEAARVAAGIPHLNLRRLLEPEAPLVEPARLLDPQVHGENHAQQRKNQNEAVEHSSSSSICRFAHLVQVAETAHDVGVIGDDPLRLLRRQGLAPRPGLTLSKERLHARYGLLVEAVLVLLPAQLLD